MKPVTTLSENVEPPWFSLCGTPRKVETRGSRWLSTTHGSHCGHCRAVFTATLLADCVTIDGWVVGRGGERRGGRGVGVRAGGLARGYRFLLEGASGIRLGLGACVHQRQF